MPGGCVIFAVAKAPAGAGRRIIDDTTTLKSLASSALVRRGAAGGALVRPQRSRDLGHMDFEVLFGVSINQYFRGLPNS